MSPKDKPSPLWMSAYIDGETDGNVALEIERQLADNPGLGKQHEELADVVQLLNALPRPTPDPDFALRVHRRIHRRQRNRRRQRGPLISPSALLGTLGTALTLLVVVGTSLALHPLRQTIETLPAADPHGVSQATLTLVVEAPAMAVQGWLIKAGARIGPNTLSPDVLAVTVPSSQLAALLDLLGSKARLHMGATMSDFPTQTRVQLQVVPAR